MQTFEFTAILAPLSIPFEEAAERLYGGGCDDGSFGQSQGVSSIEFAREAGSLEEAIASAIADVTRAGCQVVRIESDDLLTIQRFNEQLQAA